MGDYFYRNGRRLKLKKQHRLPGHDYSSPGWYFITICTKNKKFFLGDIIDNQMVLSKVGEITQIFWLEIPQRFSNVSLEVMLSDIVTKMGWSILSGSRGFMIALFETRKHYGQFDGISGRIRKDGRDRFIDLILIK